MVKYYDSISEDIGEWATKQLVFFIASAPNYGKHVNVSPKGLTSSSFSVLGPNSCAYVDATGSGNETISHLNENGRATIMFCSFEKSPRILRFFCRGTVVEWDQEAERLALLKRMNVNGLSGSRAIIVLDVFKVQTSCGYGVPMLGLGTDPDDADKQIPMLYNRDTLKDFAEKQVARGGMENYRAENNVESLDGLPGLRLARRHKGEKLLFLGDIKAGAKSNLRGLWHIAGATILVVILSNISTVLMLWNMGLIQDEKIKRWRW